jgi:hypothetical protein
MLVLCVCKSGAEYDAEWVRKLKAGVARNLTVPYEFKCLSDVDVPDRIPLRHKWPGWWSKIEVFREVTGPTLYLDLDTVVTGNIDWLTKTEHDFAAIRNFHDPDMIGSAVMWFKRPLRKVYDRFCEKPFKWIEYHDRKRDGPYLGTRLLSTTPWGARFLISRWTRSSPTNSTVSRVCPKARPWFALAGNRRLRK